MATPAQRTGALAATVVVAVAAIGFALQRAVTAPVHSIAIRFPTAAALLPGSDVLEAGAKVGSVSNIAPEADAALVTVQVSDSHWPLHRGLSAGIRPKSLLGEKYVDLHDGPASGPVYDSSQVLSAGAESTPVELDQFINSLDTSTRTSLRALLQEAGGGVAGRGVDLNQAIEAGTADLQNLARTGQTLDNRDADLDRILVGLDSVLGRITSDDQLNQLSRLIDTGRQTLNAIDAERASFSRSFADTQASLTELNTAIDPSVASLRTLLDTGPALLGILQAESDQLTGLALSITTTDGLRALETGIQRGPTASGGALEMHDGLALPIFRICVPTPDVTNPSQSTGCAGNGGPNFHLMAPVAVPAAQSGSGASMSALADFLGA